MLVQQLLQRFRLCLHSRSCRLTYSRTGRTDKHGSRGNQRDHHQPDQSKVLCPGNTFPHGLSFHTKLANSHIATGTSPCVSSASIPAILLLKYAQDYPYAHVRKKWVILRTFFSRGKGMLFIELQGILL